MKKIFTIFLLFFAFQAFSQDLIILKSGSEIKSKVLEYDEFYVRYRLFDDLSGDILSESKKNILLIKYFDGTTIVFDDDFDAQSDTSIIELSSMQKAQLAQRDAQVYYNPYGPVILAGCSSFCVPGIGALTALVPPSEQSYDMPQEYAYDEDYKYYYGKEAERIKQRKVLLATALSTTASFLFWLLIFASI